MGQKTRDWWNVKKKHEAHMLFEAASRGYDMERGQAAREAYYAAASDYRAKYAEAFDADIHPDSVRELPPTLKL